MSDSVRRRYTHRAQKTKRKVDQTRRVFEGARTVCYAVASYDLKLDSQVIVVMLIDILMFLGGLVALYFGAEWLVAGASSLAMRFGIAPLIVGLTVVAFGTSAPELLVSLLAVKDQADGVSVGNIIGSNIANIALILGCSALVAPISINKSALMREYPIMLSSGILFGGPGPGLDVVSRRRRHLVRVHGGVSRLFVRSRPQAQLHGHGGGAQ